MIDLLFLAETASWMERWLRVSHTWEVWWLGLGFIGQVIFFSRWVIQWIASERRQESYVPELFWWISIVGATMVLVYYIGRREPVGVMGQLIGWTVYSRNLYLIRTSNRRIIEDIPPGTSDEPAD